MVSGLVRVVARGQLVNGSCANTTSTICHQHHQAKTLQGEDMTVVVVLLNLKSKIFLFLNISCKIFLFSYKIYYVDFNQQILLLQEVRIMIMIKYEGNIL